MSGNNDKLKFIPYLESGDSRDMSLPLKNKPTIIFVHSSGCPHCVTAKPAVQALAQQFKDINVCAIQTDDPDCAKIWSTVFAPLREQIQGVPSYLGFNKNGKFVKIHEGGRDVRSLHDFALSL